VKKKTVFGCVFSAGVAANPQCAHSADIGGWAVLAWDAR
jgi:hypothetical protein